MLKLYVDAATRGNPGPSGIGILIVGKNIYEQLSFPLNTNMSNHEAEFSALLRGLEEIIKRNMMTDTLFVYTDSKIVAETIDKNHTSNHKFKPYLLEIQTLLASFPLILIQWLPEKQNKGADNLARQGLKKALDNK